MIDTHTHTRFSPDSREDPEKLIETAIAKGAEYLALTDHFDRDYLFGELNKSYQLDMGEYYQALVKLREKYSDMITLALGAEFGYCPEAEPIYKDICARYKGLDMIVNSVHTLIGKDAYFPDFFNGMDKNYAYTLYLDTILKSLDAPYPFCSIGHIGYVTRNAPYSDKAMRYSDYTDKIDTILNKIINKNVALEINTRSLSHDSPFMPSRGIVERYIELGGELITFASDAHAAEQVCGNYGLVKEFLLSLGVKYITGFIKLKPIMYKL
jgi:histidinol-phosphatase (PHP family)